MADGTVQPMLSMECKMAPVSNVIASLPADRNSETMEVCVRIKDGPAGTCTRHVVTDVDLPGYLNTNPAFPADYNVTIVDWALDRLGDAPPELEASVGRENSVEVSGGTTGVRCRAGGYEERTCRVKLTVKRNGRRVVVASGTGRIKPGAARTTVEASMTERGRRLLRRSGREGLRARARTTVSERYTDRGGSGSKRLRLRRH